MATLTAIKPRAFIFSRAIVKIELVQALPEDLQAYDPIWKKNVLRVGLVYWLQSSVNGNIEQTPRRITELCNPKELKEWMDLGMIWISKIPFN